MIHKLNKNDYIYLNNTHPYNKPLRIPQSQPQQFPPSPHPITKYKI